jgi:antitoxin component of RelBE/YafQ-DinJ toxin-antitoxin module
VEKKKEERIDIRVSKEKKADIHKLAEKYGMTITELILARLDNLPVKDYTKENEILPVINALTQELGFIGNNINQVTVAIHQINNLNRTHQGELHEFNKLMKQYLEKRNELSEKLQKLFPN